MSEGRRGMLERNWHATLRFLAWGWPHSNDCVTG